MSKFAENLKNLRIQNSVKQSEIASFLGVQPRAIRFYESGDREPNFDTLIKISEFYNVSIDYLVGRTENSKLYS